MAKRPTFLEQWFNPTRAAELTEHHTEEFDPEKYRDAMHARLAKLVAVARAAHGIPRRLGGDVDAETLAKDKHFSKRYGMRMLSILVASGANPALPDSYYTEHLQEVNAKAADIDWQDHVKHKIIRLNDELEVLAVHGSRQKTAPERRIYNALASSIHNEIIQTANIFTKIYPEVWPIMEEDILENLRKVRK